jgi:NADH-quinone oxidoreductase subunit A
MSNFGLTLLFALAAFILVAAGLFVGKIIRPDKPNANKLSTYESGEEPIGIVWGSFNVRFYIIALVFLLFEVELLFFFPWAVVFTDKIYNTATNGLWQWFLFAEITIFGSLLALGLFYLWKKGILDWQKTPENPKNIASKVPESLYKQFNKKYE